MSLRAFLPRATPLLLPALLASAFLACSGLKRADDPPADTDGGGDEQAVIEPDAGAADSSAPDSGGVDAGAPPLDFECTTDPWTKAAKGKKECEPRQVKTVEAESTIDTQTISIARTPAGRVGIVYNNEVDAESGEMHLAYFLPTTAVYAAPKIIKRATGFAFHDGYLSKIAASAPDTLAVLSFDRDDLSGDINLRKLVAGTEPLTMENQVATGVANPTAIALGSDSAGNTVVSYRLSTNATTAKLATKKGTPAGVFTALPDLTTALTPKSAAGVGEASIFVEASGQVHLLYPYIDAVVGPQSSQPRYHTLAGAVWSDKKTVDNNVPDGLSGFSPRVVVSGTKKYAAFFFRKAAQAVPVIADLRLVSWNAAGDVPTLEILEQQIPSDDALYPQYSVALAVDKFGLLHLAIIRPTGPNDGYLEYRRQVALPAGGTKWLSDIVDPAVISDSSVALVDMVVDENARPHIAYRSAKDGLVHYATRFDR